MAGEDGPGAAGLDAVVADDDAGAFGHADAGGGIGVGGVGDGKVGCAEGWIIPAEDKAVGIGAGSDENGVAGLGQIGGLLQGGEGGIGGARVDVVAGGSDVERAA